MKRSPVGAKGVLGTKNPTTLQENPLTSQMRLPWARHPAVLRTPTVAGLLPEAAALLPQRFPSTESPPKFTRGPSQILGTLGARDTQLQTMAEKSAACTLMKHSFRQRAQL